MERLSTGADPGFSIRGSMKGGRPPPCRSGIWEHPSHKNFEISSPRKHDFRHFEAKSSCFNISFFQSDNAILFASKYNYYSCVTTMQICIQKTMIKIYCINVINFQFCVSLKTGSIRSILRYLSEKS